MKKLRILAVILFFCVLLPATAAFSQGSADTSTLVDNNNTFALSLYKTLSEQEGNLFFSPYSISTALAMTWLGARGKTADEMGKTLKFSLEASRIHPAFKSLITGMNSRQNKDAYELVIANRLWGQKGYTFLKSFLRDEEKYYSSPLKELDFKSNPEKARGIINRWVEKKTRDRIKDLIAKGILKKDARLVLTNAIYFKSGWQETFSKEATRKEPFHLSRTQKADVDMMHRTDRLRYGSFNDMDMLDIPYKSGELSMLVLLPSKLDGIGNVGKTLDYKKLNRCISKLSVCKVELSLPRFKTTSELALKETLEKMGMTTPFIYGQADFSGMDGTKLLYISQVVHKAFVDVNEEGTEAAAATAVLMVAGSAPPREEKIVAFKVDHPFIFIIRDNTSGSFLFVGRIMDPTRN